jgi:uncharacterized cupin superfamily protein
MTASSSVPAENGTYTVAKVVTGRTDDGGSVVLEQCPVQPHTMLGIDFFPIWGTAAGLPVVRARDDDCLAVSSPFFPGTGGTRMIVLRFQPESASGADDDPEAAAAAAERAAPGLLSAFEPDTPGMHTTDTIDYCICLDGEIHLELDDGAEVLITAGTCVVQRGTRHAWYNRGDRPCTILAVIIGAERH